VAKIQINALLPKSNSKNTTLYLKCSKISISFYTALPSNVNLADKNTVNNILAERSAQFDF